MEKQTEKRNYAGYLPKRSNIAKLEIYLKEVKQKPTVQPTNLTVNKSKVLKNKRF